MLRLIGCSGGFVKGDLSSLQEQVVSLEEKLGGTTVVIQGLKLAEQRAQLQAEEEYDKLRV